MSESISSKIKNKISEDLSPTRNITGFHLKIVSAIAIIWSLFQLWYASPFPFMLNFGMFKGLPARAIHLGFALTLAFLIYPISKGKKISVLDVVISLIGAFLLWKFKVNIIIWALPTAVNFINPVQDNIPTNWPEGPLERLDFMILNKAVFLSMIRILKVCLKTHSED